MKLLVSYPKFQLKVKEARYFLELPENGLTSDKQATEWELKMEERSEKIMDSRDFQSVLKKKYVKILRRVLLHEERRKNKMIY